MKLPYQPNLDGKVAVITGAGGVLMSEFARVLAECGAKVALLDINAEAVQKVAEGIGENALPVPTNCLEKDSILSARETVRKAFGKVQHCMA